MTAIERLAASLEAVGDVRIGEPMSRPTTFRGRGAPGAGGSRCRGTQRSGWAVPRTCT